MVDGIILEARKIVKRFPGVMALNQVDFTLKKNEIHALIGENGAGKSTLIKILTGVYTKDAGSIFLFGKEVTQISQIKDKIAFVPQELNLFPHLTIAENIFIPIEPKNRKKGFFINYKRMNEEANNILSLLQINLNPKTKINKIDSANRQMVQIARAIAQNLEILILDEPTSSVSYKETESLFNILRTLKFQGKSIIYITHKLEELYNLVDRVTILRDGNFVGTSDIKEIDHNKIVSLMAGSRLAKIETELIKNKDIEKKRIIFRVENLSGKGFQKINFDLHEMEILGFAGLVGAGRTEIAKTILGVLPANSGKIFIKEKEQRIQSPADAVKVGLVYISEDRKQSGIFANLTVKENISLPILQQLASLHFISNEKEKSLVKSLVNRFNIKVPSIEQKMKFLSGGNQQKAIIARSISIRPQIIIFDEPTKGIDVNSKAEIYSQLRELAKTGLGIIIISSDMEELLKIADRIIVIQKGQIKGVFKGESSSREELLRSAIGLN
jgi:ribose transport system ATP-binding protein